MTSIRSISNSRTADRLLNRRLARTSASATPASPRRIALTKTGSVKVSSSAANHKNSTHSPLKSNRMYTHHNSLTSLAPTPIPSNGHATLSPKDSLESSKSTKIVDLPPLRPSSRSSDVGAIALSTKQMTVEDEQKENQESVSHSFPSAEYSQFTLDSFDILRTIGTGNYSNDRQMSRMIMSAFFIICRYLWSRSSRLSSRE